MEDEVQPIAMKDYFSELQKEMNMMNMEVESMETEDDLLDFTLAENVAAFICCSAISDNELLKPFYVLSRNGWIRSFKQLRCEWHNFQYNNSIENFRGEKFLIKCRTQNSNNSSSIESPDKIEGTSVSDGWCDSRTQIVQMEKTCKVSKEKPISQVTCEELAAKFSCSPHRCEKSSVKWEQVQRWFQDKEKSLALTVTPSSSCKAIVAYTNPAPKRKKPKVLVPTISADEAAVAISNLIFEAKSAKDYAWFDVGSFLNYKVLTSGEVVVRVRFAGFNKDEDEWVHVNGAVRERSIPLQVSECHKVNVGDLVLCFREDEDYALYCDAHIVDIQRKLHDIEGCQCIFVVRYVTDSHEDNVVLNKLCCRPSAANLTIDDKPSVMDE